MKRPKETLWAHTHTQNRQYPPFSIFLKILFERERESAQVGGRAEGMDN